MADAPPRGNGSGALPRLPSRPVIWVVAAVTLLLAGWSAMWSLAVAMQNRNPALAATINASLPQAAARLGDLRILAIYQKSLGPDGLAQLQQGGPAAASAAMLGGAGMKLSPQERTTIAADARAVLATTPYSSKALRQLATAATDPAQRERLLRLANAVSKRDTMASLQLAELDLRQGRLAGGLAALNQALIVSTNLDNTVFPLLAAAAADPQAAGQIGSLLRRDPEWADRMMRWATANPAAIAPLSSVLRYIPKDSVAHAPGYGQQFIDQLASQGRYAEAFAAFEAYSDHPQDVGNLALDTFRPIDWRLIDNYDTGGRPFGKDQVEVFANPGRLGSVAEVVTRLAPGSYRFSLRLNEALGKEAQLRFAVECVEPGNSRGLTQQAVPLANGPRGFSFTVPTACAFQKLTLAVEATTDAAGALIGDVALQRGAAAAPAARTAAGL